MTSDSRTDRSRTQSAEGFAAAVHPGECAR